MNVLITGIMGQVGYNLAKLFSNQSNKVLGIYNNQVCFEFPSHKLDLNNEVSTPRNTLQNLDLDLIIHCAAITDVNFAQKNPSITYKINTNATQHMLDLAKSKDIPFIYLSTDFVFNGFCGNYTEDSTPEPLSHYGYSKLYGESSVRNYKKGITLRFTPIAHRINLPHHGHSLMDWIIQSSLLGENIQLFHDKTFSPVSSNEIFHTILNLLQNDQFGLFHLASEPTSIFQAGRFIQEVFKIKPVVEASTFPNNDYSKIRPKYSHLSSKYLPTFHLKTILENIKSQRGLK
jgi:dTDP-4-dehydrorhamnose reductase